MKLKPTRLFGVEQRNKPCYFIHNEGEGYWFLSLKERTVGEARLLKKISTEIEELEINSNWLILEITKVKREEILKQIADTNFTVGDENKKLNTLSKAETDRLAEIYVRSLIGDLDFTNSVLWQYKDRLEANISKNRSLFFDYQMSVVETIFKCRVINDVSIIVFDDEDVEKGHVPSSCLVNGDKNLIGLVGDFNYNDLPENLALKIYQYANNDFAGLEIQTTAMLEAKKESETQTENLEPETGQEKKIVTELALSKESKK